MSPLTGAISGFAPTRELAPLLATYDHCFHQFLDPVDVAFSALKVAVFVLLSTFVQCYSGFVASDGPEGELAVGDAGQAVQGDGVSLSALITQAADLANGQGARHWVGRAGRDAEGGLRSDRRRPTGS